MRRQDPGGLLLSCKAPLGWLRPSVLSDTEGAKCQSLLPTIAKCICEMLIAECQGGTALVPQMRLKPRFSLVA